MRKNRTQELYNQTVSEALIHLEYLVNQAFENDSRLTDFVIAMGSYTFRAKRQGIIDSYDFEKYPAIRATLEFVDEWDDYLKLSGAGIWFKSDGIKLTDW